MKYTWLLIALLGLHNKTRAQAASAGETYFTNVELIDQYGEPQQLFTGLMKDKTVIVNAFHTDCTSVVPVMNNVLRKVREYLGDKMGESVNILSLTVDYRHDRPDVLRSYAERLNAAKGWYFLTGEKDNIELALKKFGLYVEYKEAHSTLFMVGNLRTGLWKKVFGMAQADEIIKIIDSVVNDGNQ